MLLCLLGINVHYTFLCIYISQQLHYMWWPKSLQTNVARIIYTVLVETLNPAQSISIISALNAIKP